MKADTNLGEFTHPVHRNSFGYFAMHSFDNQPLPQKASEGIINGPLAAMQSKLTKELAGDNDHANESLTAKKSK